MFTCKVCLEVKVYTLREPDMCDYCLIDSKTQQIPEIVMQKKKVNNLITSTCQICGLKEIYTPDDWLIAHGPTCFNCVRAHRLVEPQISKKIEEPKIVEGGRFVDLS